MPEYHVRIRELPAGERPRERLVKYGATTLSNADLLAIILRVGVAGQNVVHVAEALLRDFGGLPGIHRATISELSRVRGIGPDKAAQLHAALELGKRLVATQPEDRTTVTSPADVLNLLEAEMNLLEQEHVKVLLLNTRNELVRTEEVYKGTLNAAHVRIAELLRPAVREAAKALVVVHNHPSGNPMPSPQDIVMTAELVKAAAIFDLEVLDHIIIGRAPTRYFSMKDAGMGFPRAATTPRP